MLFRLITDANALIRNGEQDGALRILEPYLYLAALRTELYGVTDKIIPNVMKKRLVSDEIRIAH